MSVIFKGNLSTDTWVNGPREVTIDEWGNKLVTVTLYHSGNQLEFLMNQQGPLNEMATTWDTISRSATYDLQSGITSVQETYVETYADSDDKRYSIDAQSGREPITAHPDFEELAGTPDEPNLTNAVWVKADDAEGTMRFVELKGTYAGLEQFISGSGSVLKEQWVDLWENVQFDQDMGKIKYPENSGIWGGATSWLLVGMSAEPFGSRYKFTYVYKQASSKASRNGGWSTAFYS